jgi:hypothetical protein
MSLSSEKKYIFERKLKGIDPNGNKIEIFLGIGSAYFTDLGSWSVAISVFPIYKDLSEVHGADSWQAVKLARDNCLSLLKKFINDGGKIYYEYGESEITIAEIEKEF